jgi:TonB family protein
MTRSKLSLSLLALSTFATTALTAGAADAHVAAASANAAAQRIVGEKVVRPDTLTAAAIVRAELERVVGVFNVCIDSKGDVADISVVRSTSFYAYDAKIQRQIRTWKYAPVLLGGQPAPVCTTVTFIYQQQL